MVRLNYRNGYPSNATLLMAGPARNSSSLLLSISANRPEGRPGPIKFAIVVRLF